MAIDVAAFAIAPEAVALKVSSADLPGLLTKRLVVPDGAAALVRDEDGREELLRAGAEATGRFGALIVKDREFAIPFQVQGLPTKEGVETTAGVEIVVAVPPRAIQLREFRDAILEGRERADIGDLRCYLLPSVRAALALFVSTRTAEELASEDPRPELERRLREELKAPCFAAGLDLRDVRHPSFFSEEYERRRRAALEARAREEELAARERLQQYAARLERNEMLKQHEIEEFARVLQYQGVLKELSLKNDVDRRRKEEDLRKFEALHAKLGNDDVKALIFLLEDERLKAELIQRLIERDMTEDQLRARRAEEIERRLEERMNEFSRKMAAIVGACEAKLADRGMRTRRVLGALGKQILAFDPATNVRREAAKEVYDHERGGLGYLRSVRVIVTRDGRFVAAGAQRGVYLTREGSFGREGVAGEGGAPSPADRSRDVRELRFPRDPSGQGGVNAIAYFDGHIYATHSELGVFRWDTFMLARPEPLFESVTRGNESTRGAVTTADGKLYFASGDSVWRADLLRPTNEVARFRGADEAITTFVLSRDELFAGTRAGRIVRWSLSDPGSPRELNVRKAEPIYMLKVAELHGDPHLLIGAKEHGLTAVSLEDGRAFDYRAHDQIRWVDGASDYVFGVSRGGYAIHVFEAARLEGEAFTIRVPDKIQDIAVQKEPIARGGAAAA